MTGFIAFLALLLPLQSEDRKPAILYVQAGEGLRWFRIDPAAGAPSALGVLATPGFSPTYLRESPDGRFLFAAGSERLRVYSIGSDGALSLAAETASSGGPSYVDVHPSGRFAATANYASRETLLYPVGTDGSLGKPRSFPTGDQTHSARFHPSGRSLFALAVGDRWITAIPTEGGASPTSRVLPGLGPRHAVFSADGRRCFVVHERPIRVSALKVDADGAAWEPVGDWPALPPGAPTKQEFGAAEIALAPSGRFVYASVRDFSDPLEANGMNGLAVFAVDPSSGALTWVEFVDSGGVLPRGFVVDPSGPRLHVLNERSSTLVRFRIDPESGRLRRDGDAVPVGGRAVGIALVGPR